MKTYKRSILIVVLVMVFSLAGMRSSVFAIDDEDSRETLRGIKGVMVAIEDIGSEIEKDGLTRSQIQTDVELKLRMAGLSVLTRGEVLKAPGNPWVYVGVSIVKTPLGMYIYSIGLELRQSVHLERNNKGSRTPTWFIDRLGGTLDLDSIRSKIKDLVDIFINAWLSVNPK